MTGIIFFFLNSIQEDKRYTKATGAYRDTNRHPSSKKGRRKKSKTKKKERETTRLKLN